MDRLSSFAAEVKAVALQGGRAGFNWLEERLGLRPVIAIARKKHVPDHAQSFWYYWGGLSLFFFLVQVATGILLLCYYRPGPEAYASVRAISYETDFGWLIRSVHAWGANLMVFCVVVHMFSVFFMRAYRSPREFGWWTGLGLLALTMVFGFSGYLLPMDELAYFATKVGLSIPETIPLVGPYLMNFIRGGAEVSEYTIQRFFALHVALLPFLFGPLLGLHLYLVTLHGNAVPESEEDKAAEERRSMPFVPDFLVKDLGMWVVGLTVLCGLALFLPWELGPQADPLAPAPLGIHPEWYFMSQFQLLKFFGQIFPGLIGELIPILLINLGGAIWALVPLLDPGRRAPLATWRAPAVFAYGVLFLVLNIVLTVWAYAAL